MDKAVHRIILYPLDSAIGFRNTYPLYGDLSDPKKMQMTISTGSISIQGIAQLVFLLLIRWVAIYPTDSAIQRLSNWSLVDSAMAIFWTVNRDKFRSSTNFIFHNYEVQWTNFSVFCLLVCFFSLLFFRSSSLPALVIRINNSWIMKKWDRVLVAFDNRTELQVSTNLPFVELNEDQFI